MNKEEKQFGLIKPKPALSAPKAGNIFGDDDDSDADEGVDWVKKALKAASEKTRLKKQTKLSIAKALNEDPTIYQYDEIYDKLEKNKEPTKTEAKKEVEKKPKYLHNFMKNAERRKREQEHRIERMVQKEREAEGEVFADKESFVTSAYRAKLEEFKKMEEEEERMERLEAIGDVTKQKDLSGFYRHIFAQSVDGTKEQEDEKPTEKPSEATPDDQDTSESDSGSEKEESSKFTSKSKKSRQYRRQKVEESPSEESESEKEAPEEPVDSETPAKKPKLDDQAPEISNESKAKPKPPEEDVKDNKIEKKETNNVTKNVVPVKSDEEKREPEKKINIWEKRTVGAVLEAALQRYYARKAAKLSGSYP